MLPPSTTIRKYQRNLLSTTSASLGSIYCSILSFANTKNEPEIQEIYSSLVALRGKLEKSTALRANVGYEVCPALSSCVSWFAHICSTSFPYVDVGQPIGITRLQICRCTEFFMTYSLCFSVYSPGLQSDRVFTVPSDIGYQTSRTIMGACVSPSNTVYGPWFSGWRVGCAMSVIKSL